MMGSTLKQESADELRLERKILDRRDLIIVKRNLCNGCGICAEVCPKDAVNIRVAVIENKKLSCFPVVDIDANACILCGVCSFFCPLNALEAWINNEKTTMFAKAKSLPQATKTIKVAQDICKPDCGIECEKSCPREAIRVDVQKKKNGQVQKILKVQVAQDLCFYCKICEYACPYGAIAVEKFLEGAVAVEAEKCPQNCQVCIDVCPTRAIATSENGKVQVSKEICIYCRACQNLCPEEAINVTIDQVSHTPVTSALWTTLLGRFTSYRTAMKELAAKSRKKLESIVESRI